MKPRVLFVDDEINVLKAYQRNLRKSFEVHIAACGNEAIDIIKNAEEVYPAIVVDMQMPQMNGLELLELISELSPLSVKIMLTGNADQKTASDAINRGQIFRFINKPSSPEEVTSFLNLAIEHHKLLRVEKDLLENTLKGSIKALSEALELSNPEVFGRTSRLKRYMVKTVSMLGVSDIWIYEALSMMCLIGCVSLPPQLINQINSGQKLDPNFQQMFNFHAELGFELLMKIPKMETVAKAVRYQNKHFDGSGYPEDDLRGKAIPVASRILKVILDYDHFESMSNNKEYALKKINDNKGRIYDPKIAELFGQALDLIDTPNVQLLSIAELNNNMRLAQDIETQAGALLLCKGLDLSDSVISRLKSFHRTGAISDKIYITQS